MDFIETLKKYSIDMPLQLINVLSQNNSRWLPYLTDLKKYKNCFNSVNVTDVVVKSGVVLVESPTSNATH